MVGKSFKKIDYKSILLGEKSYTGDFANSRDLLHIKVLRSPHAFAKILSIDSEKAMKLPGMVAVYTYEDVPKTRFTECGESFPEASPHDRLILDQIVRYVGDDVALVVGESLEVVEKALRLIKVKYQVYKPILSPEEALEEGASRIHPEDDWYQPFDFGYDPSRNIVSRFEYGQGDVEKGAEEAELIVESEYESQQQAHAMMETLRAHARIDERGRLEIISANQSIYHMRRQVALALGLSLNQLRLRRVRIGGGFGGKNVALTEPIVGFVTWKTKRPSYIAYDRKENFTSTTTRHNMKFKLRIGARKDGKIVFIDMEALNNSGAYGGNGPAVTMEAGQNTLPLYSGQVEHIRYRGITAYTNTVTAGALRGYGTPQGTFALNGTINELAAKLGMDPEELIRKNTSRKGDCGGIIPEALGSLNVEACLDKTKELIGWDGKRSKGLKGDKDHLVRGVGFANAIHSSGISNIDVSKIRLRLEEDGSFTIFTASSDLGTGSDTILKQIAARALNTDFSKVTIVSGDTDSCPYDTGAYASCTTYLTGNAVLLACEALEEKILAYAGRELGEEVEELVLVEDYVINRENPDKKIDLRQLGINASVGSTAQALAVEESYSIGASPRPYISAMAEVEINTRTGELRVLNYVTAIDCGTVINPNLARIQAEGGGLMGIGYALYEDVKYGSNGRLKTDSFLTYTIPTRKDVANIEVAFCPEEEPSGPYGAKSMAELVVNPSAPALAEAIYDAIGVRLRSLPMTQEDILRGLREKNL